MKFLEFDARILKIMEFELFQSRIMKNHEILTIPCKNKENRRRLINARQHNENHEIHKIPLQNHANNLNLRIPRQNYENHEIDTIQCRKNENHWNLISRFQKS